MNAERRLFLTLWGLLLLSGALWYFWPNPTVSVTAKIPVSLAPELANWIDSAEAEDPEASQVTLSLHPRKASPTIELGYSLQGAAGPLHQGSIRCALEAGPMKLALPNPARVSTREVRLYLAR